jgi:predicted metal-dependent peptidase
MSPEQIERYNRLSKLFETLPPNMTSEFYFDVLNENKDIKDMMSEGECNFPGIPGPLDSHDMWDQLSDEDRELAEAKLKEVLKDAVAEAATKGWGSIPCKIQQAIAKSISREIKWEDILRRFCGFSQRQSRVASHKKLSRKYPGIHPGYASDYIATIAIYVDESGSMSDAILSLLYAELNVLAVKVNFYVYRFCTAVDVESGFLWKKGKKVDLLRERMGGTDFNAPTAHANKSRKIDGYVIMTDGYAPIPTEFNRVKRCWIITPDGDSDFSGSKGDICVKMNC